MTEVIKSYISEYRSRLRASEIDELEGILDWSFASNTEMLDITHRIDYEGHSGEVLFEKHYCSLKLFIGEEYIDIATTIVCGDLKFDENLLEYVADVIKANKYRVNEFQKLNNI